MATDSWYWIGPSGPYPYEAGVTKCNDVNDRSGIAVAGQIDLMSLQTTGQISVQTAPTDATHVLREDDIGGIVGDVVGPASSTDNEVPRFDGVTGKLLQSDATTPLIVDDSAHITQFGGNIKFPAVAVPSADVNVLDDYEEGVWTPAISFGGASVGVTYGGTNAGVYTKIGRVIFFSGALVLTSKGTSVGAVLVTGLPFTATKTVAVSVGSPNAISFADFLASYVLSASTTIKLQNITNAGALTNLDNTNFINTSSVIISGHYI
jgi:hypothetical protein